MPRFGALGKFFGKTVSEGAAFAAGVAVAPTLEPVVQDVKNEAWSKHQSRPLDPETAAAIVAEDVAEQPWGESEAAATGISKSRFDRLLGEALNGPGVAMLTEARRRNIITPAQFTHGLRKAKLENLWDAPLTKLLDARLSPQAVALAIVRSVINDAGLLVTDLDTSGGRVPAYQVSNIDPIAEAAAAGVDKERLRVMVGSIGLPMSAQAAAVAYFKGLIDRPDYNRAVIEGDTRPEWGDAILDNARPIPTVATYVEAYVRGWIDQPGFLAGTRRHGMSDDDAQLEFLTHGRPLSWHQVWIGLARGGKYDGPISGIDPAFLKSLRESNIRPEWYDLAWAQRYSYPAAFVLRALAQGGDLTEEETRTILLYEGWEPTLAAQVAKRWAGTKGTAAKEATVTDLLTLWDGEQATTAETLAAIEALGYPTDEARQKMATIAARRVQSSRNTAISDLHALFKKSDVTVEQAAAAIAKLGVSPEDAARIVANWNVVLTSAG